MGLQRENWHATERQQLIHLLHRGYYGLKLGKNLKVIRKQLTVGF